jgi:hypothetical protein
MEAPSMEAPSMEAPSIEEVSIRKQLIATPWEHILFETETSEETMYSKLTPAQICSLMEIIPMLKQLYSYRDTYHKYPDFIFQYGLPKAQIDVRRMYKIDYHPYTGFLKTWVIRKNIFSYPDFMPFLYCISRFHPEDLSSCYTTGQEAFQRVLKYVYRGLMTFNDYIKYSQLRASICYTAWKYGEILVRYYLIFDANNITVDDFGPDYYISPDVYFNLSEKQQNFISSNFHSKLFPHLEKKAITVDQLLFSVSKIFENISFTENNALYEIDHILKMNKRWGHIKGGIVLHTSLINHKYEKNSGCEKKATIVLYNKRFLMHFASFM